MKPHPANPCKICSIQNKAGGFCHGLSESQRAALNEGSRKTDLKRSASIPNKELLIWPILAISSGVLSLQHLLEDGRKTIAALFMPGDIVDMRGLPHRNRGQLVALAKTSLCRLSPVAFEAVINTNPQAQKIAWHNLRNQTYRAMDHASDLAKKQALEKLASFIFECASRQPKQDAPRQIKIPIRRIDLADYLGMQPETVSRGFKYLEERKIIAFQGISNLNILDIPTLRRIANGDKNMGSVRNHNESTFKAINSA